MTNNSQPTNPQQPEVCPRCLGTGEIWYPSTDTTEVCDFCNGTGTVTSAQSNKDAVTTATPRTSQPEMSEQNQEQQHNPLPADKLMKMLVSLYKADPNATGDQIDPASVYRHVAAERQAAVKEGWQAVKDIALSMNTSTVSAAVEIVLHAQKRLAELTKEQP